MNDSSQKYFLRPGYIFFSEQPYLIYTVLGSCVSVCVWDCMRRFGGVNHYIYSTADGKNRNAKYGDISIRYLIGLMMGAGSLRRLLKAHVIGGGQNPELGSTIGEENVMIADEILGSYGIEVLTHDTGGNTGRKLIFDNESGEIVIYKGISIRRDDWYHRSAQ